MVVVLVECEVCQQAVDAFDFSVTCKSVYSHDIACFLDLLEQLIQVSPMSSHCPSR